MAGPPASRLLLPREDKRVLRELRRTHSAEARYVRRARILLYCERGVAHEEIAVLFARRFWSNCTRTRHLGMPGGRGHARMGGHPGGRVGPCEVRARCVPLGGVESSLFYAHVAQRRARFDLRVEVLAAVVDHQSWERGAGLDAALRVHTEICRFISGAVYEDRLQPDPGTVRRVVRVPAKGARWVQAEAGIVFLPVEHEGNTQGSAEEVERILEAWKELKGRVVTDREGKVTGALGLEDVLFVAPYNMQVRMLRQALPAGAKVGSVDKFQGQEAPVVVVSLCTSFGESGPRGLDFVLDRNRLNVAISRAQSLAVVVGDPRLARSPCGTVEQMARLNLLCRLMEQRPA